MWLIKFLNLKVFSLCRYFEPPLFLACLSVYRLGGDDNRDDDYTSAMTTKRTGIKENANIKLCVNKN